MLVLVGCGATVGDACRTASDCGNGVCITRDFAPDGLCSVACVLDGSACPAGSVCVKRALGRDAPGCLRACTKDSECRSGYLCSAPEGEGPKVCLGPTGI